MKFVTWLINNEVFQRWVAVEDLDEFTDHVAYIDGAIILIEEDD